MNQLETYFRACLNATYETGENGASWAIEWEGDHLFLLFEHSNGLTDWLNNLNFHAVPYRDMNPVWQCHGGFLRSWKGAKPAIEQAMASRSCRRVTVIGYSHGAALAMLCHEWVWYHYPVLRGSLVGFGFGCPRVLYGCAAPELAERWRSFFVVRNLDDTVTHLPPRVMGYCHVGNLVCIGQDGRYSGMDAHRPESYLAELSKTGAGDKQ